VISRGNVLEQITGSSPVMTNGGEPGDDERRRAR